MDLGIAGRRALVTGGSAGIGRAIASSLAREGARVAIVARDAGRLAQAAAEIEKLGDGPVVPIAADCRAPDQIVRAIAEAEAGLGWVDILVNNAGDTPIGTLESANDLVWQESLALKLMGYVRFTRALVGGMRQRRWGRVVNIIGRSGREPQGTYAVGSTINAALLGFTKAIAADLAKDNVLVNGINPGPIDTERWRRMVAQRAGLGQTDEQAANAAAIRGIPLGRLGAPEEIAAMAALLCSERASFVTGALIDVDGGATRRL